MTVTRVSMRHGHHRYREFTMAAATTATPPLRAGASAAGARRWLVDLGLWLLVYIPMVASPFVDQRAEVAADVPGALLALGLIVARHRWPVPTLGAGLAASFAFTAITQRPSALLPVVVVLLFEVAVRHDRATAIRAGAAGLVTMLSSIVILVSSDPFGPELLAGLAWPALAVAAGDAVRSRREAIAAAEDRATRAEATREAEARRRVVEERLHIARELHDVVAHQIAVINVQAGVAAHLLDDEPDDAKAALATVRSSARQVLDEFAAILGVLRTSDAVATDTEPAPTIDDLHTLVASFAAVDLTVVLDTVGEPRPVSDATAIAVYRTVQEALTNAHKHGDGHAHLRIVHHAETLDIEVSNRFAPSAPDMARSGYGLVGMRERVHAAGGTVTSGPRSSDTFVVSASFPTTRVPDVAP
jgi:signal transduction histidine kinase